MSKVILNRVARYSISRMLITILLVMALLSGLTIYVVTGYLEQQSVNQMAVSSARQTSELVFQSLYSVMRKGWDRDDVREATQRLNHAIPDMDVQVIRSQKVVELFGATEVSEQAREGNPLVADVLANGRERLDVNDERIRFYYPILVQEECIACHGNVKSGDINGVIAVTIPVKQLRIPLEFTLRSTIYAFSLAILLLFGVIFFQVRHFMARPIIELARHMEEIQESRDLGGRLEKEMVWIKEIRSLTRNYNNLMERLEQAHKDLLAQSETDPLTGLLNRRRFDQLVTKELRRSKRYGHSCAVLMVDLDKFKPINDEYGHAAGDAMLILLAAVLRETLRENDAIARMGGDEFVIMAPETPVSEIGAIKEKVHQAIDGAQLSFEGHTLSVGASIGVASFPDDGETEEALLHAADERMYQDKQERKAGR